MKLPHLKLSRIPVMDGGREWGEGLCSSCRTATLLGPLNGKSAFKLWRLFVARHFECMTVRPLTRKEEGWLRWALSRTT